MPELPEVETTRRGIAPHLENRRIHSISAHIAKLRQPLDTAELSRISGHTLTRIERRGKHLILHSDQPELALHIHLGMSGALRITPASSPHKKHDHVAITLDNGDELRLHDPRRFGHVALIDPTRPPASLANLGDEPLDDNFNGARLYAQTRGKKSAIKTHIMNQPSIRRAPPQHSPAPTATAWRKPSRQYYKPPSPRAAPPCATSPNRTARTATSHKPSTPTAEAANPARAASARYKT